MKPPKWTDVYPQGTPEGDQEYEFFIALARDKEVWRSTHGLAGQTGLPLDIIENIIDKYIRKGMVFQHDHKDDHWAYWERVPDKVPKPHKSLVEKDHESRMDRFSGCDDNDGCCTKVIEKPKGDMFWGCLNGNWGWYRI